MLGTLFQNQATAHATKDANYRLEKMRASEISDHGCAQCQHWQHAERVQRRKSVTEDSGQTRMLRQTSITKFGVQRGIAKPSQEGINFVEASVAVGIP